MLPVAPNGTGARCCLQIGCQPAYHASTSEGETGNPHFDKWGRFIVKAGLQPYPRRTERDRYVVRQGELKRDRFRFVRRDRQRAAHFVARQHGFFFKFLIIDFADVRCD